MHPSKLPILIEQVLYHAEFWYLIAASYTRRVDLILLDQQIRILPADAKHFLKMLHRHHIRVVLEHRQIPLRLSVRLFLNQSAGCDLAHPMLCRCAVPAFCRPCLHGHNHTGGRSDWSFPESRPPVHRLRSHGWYLPQ